MRKALAIVLFILPAALAAQTINHTWDFPDFLQNRKLAVMFSMSWFGIPSTDPQGNVPSGTEDKDYGQWGPRTFCDSKSDPKLTTTCIKIGHDNNIGDGNEVCLQQGAAQRDISSRRKPLAGIYSASGRNFESRNRVRLMLSNLRRTCDDGARLDAWAVQIKSVRFSSKYYTVGQANYHAISDYEWRALKAFFEEADAAGMTGAVLPGYDDTDYAQQWFADRGVDCRIDPPTQTCLDAIAQDLADLVTEASRHPSAVTYNGKPVLVIYVKGDLTAADYRDQILPSARQRAGKDFYLIGLTTNQSYFEAFDALAPWINSWTWDTSTCAGSDLATRAYCWTRERHKGLLYTLFNSSSPYKDASGKPTRAVLGSITPGFDDYTFNWGSCSERQIPDPNPTYLPAGNPRDPVLLDQQFRYFTDCKNGINCATSASRYEFRGFVGETWDDWTEGSEFEPDVSEGPNRLLKLRQGLGDYWGERGTTADTQGDTRLTSRWNNYGQARNGSLTAPAGTPPTVDLACPSAYDTPLPLTVAASSPDDGNGPVNTLDNDLATRWSSQYDGAYITYDLGSVKTVSSVEIAWHLGDTRTDTFDIQVSSDNVNFTTVLSGAVSSGASVAQQYFGFSPVQARYVKYVGHTNSANNWNAVTEFDAYSRANPVLELPVTVAASSPDDGNGPANTLDNNLATRWSSQYDGAYITYDLGGPRTVSSIAIAWNQGDTRVDTFDVQVSLDGTSWTTVLANQTSSGTTLAQQPFSFAETQARYVKYVGHMNSVNNWNSLTEVDIYGR